MKIAIAATLVLGLCGLASVTAQNNAPANGTHPSHDQANPDSEATLRVTSRAVLVDVIVTDNSGKPVIGLKKDDFKVAEQGKPQTVSFFEEHAPPAAPPNVQMPQLPPDVFTNFSPFPPPPAVNVLLLDSLNTTMENQGVVHKQALNFLKTAKPGSRMAIFTMGLGLHFIQGFNDDPAVLAAALNNKKNNEVQSSVMLKSGDETNAQQNVLGMMSATAPGGVGTAGSAEAIAALQNFFQQNDTAQSADRIFVTLANLQRLASFLQGFPGRKNIIWFAETFPSIFITNSGNTVGATTDNPALSGEIEKTLAMLATARVALYPVDARGVSGNALYTAANNMSSSISEGSQLLGATGVAGSGGFATALTGEDLQRNGDQANAQIVAEQSGGKAFANSNGLAQIIGEISASSNYFYTLSYVPTDPRMGGGMRKIDVKIPGGNYHLSYRRGYFAVDDALPGSSLVQRSQAIHKFDAQHPGAVDPLLTFMDLGMPQSEQILYKILVQPIAATDPRAAADKNRKGIENHYSVDFAVDLKDLNLKLDSAGLRTGTLNVSLIAYDRYGRIANRSDHLINLNIKPDVYALFQNTGVQLKAEIGVPKGQYWLRTGVYDQGSRKVGTMEIPLSSVKPLQASAK